MRTLLVLFVISGVAHAGVTVDWAKGVVTAGFNLMGSLGTLAKKVRNETR